MKRRAPDSPDWAAAMLGDFLHALIRKLACLACIAVALVFAGALAIALYDLHGPTP